MMIIDVKTIDTERENTKYVDIDGERLIIVDGEIIGWYRP